MKFASEKLPFPGEASYLMGGIKTGEKPETRTRTQKGRRDGIFRCAPRASGIARYTMRQVTKVTGYANADYTRLASVINSAIQHWAAFFPRPLPPGIDGFFVSRVRGFRAMERFSWLGGFRVFRDCPWISRMWKTCEFFPIFAQVTLGFYFPWNFANVMDMFQFCFLSKRGSIRDI